MKYFFVVGEASGDLHASNLIAALDKVDADAKFMFLGGDKMCNAAGTEPIVHYRQMAFMGFWSVLKNAQTIWRNWQTCRQSIEHFAPDVVVLVDYPSFNLRVARYVKKHCPNTKVYYYISPKIWAWKTYRIKAIKRYVDKMFTIFPFETPFYQQYGYTVHYVGNPTVDSVANSLSEKSNNCNDDFRHRYALSDKPIIALLPGSRKQEIVACLPKMLSACRTYSDYQIVVAVAPSMEENFYRSLVPETPMTLIADDTYRIVAQAEVAIVNSGTASLETCLIGTPQVVVYHVGGGRMTLWLKDIFIKVKYISLVNLIANRLVVRELIGYLFTAQSLSLEVNKLLYDTDYRESMLTAYADVQDKLGKEGCAKEAAKQIYHALLCE